MELKHTATREGRLSSFLLGELKMSTGLMNKLKWGDGIRVNGIPQRTSYPVCPGDVVTVRLEEETAEYPAEEGPLDRASKMTLWQAVEKLELPYRTVVVLFYYDGCSVKEIASVTASTAAAVRQQLARARKMLAAMLDRKDFEI